MIRSTLTDTHLYSPRLHAWAQRLSTLCDSRVVPWLLLAIGMGRNVLLLLAYPPAHASDSHLFFLYAERLAGYDAALMDKYTYPLYPFLILVTVKWLGSVYWLIAVQFVMSALLAPIYYFTLKPYSRTLALAVGLVILVDFQSGVTFNFTGAEPLYMFLMGLSFLVLLRQISPQADKHWTWRDSSTGMLLVLLWLTRTIGRYLIIPYAIVYLLYTRSIKRTLTMIAGFGGALVIYMLLSTLALGQVAGLNATDYSFERVMRHHADWVQPENGENTRIWLEATADCPSENQFQQVYCLYQRVGTWEGAESIIQGTAFETVRPHLGEYLWEVWNNFLYFLGADANMFTHDGVTPSEAQCITAEQRIGYITTEYVTTTFVERLNGHILHLEGAELEAAVDEYRGMMSGIIRAMCPPLPDSPQIRQIVDWVLVRNRSFGRPNPQVWYGAVLLLSLVIPWARRYLPVVLIVGVTMSMLAISPAMLSVQTNLRYIIVINALRITLLGILVWIVCPLAIYALDWFMARRSLSPHTAINDMDTDKAGVE